MSWLRQTLDSSVGGKFLVAITGIGLVGFVVAHLAGNLLVFGGPAAINSYAEGLRTYPAALWTLRIGLVVMTIAHVAVAIRLNMQSRRARPVPYAKKQYARASLQSRTMVLTGLLVLFYALFHLAHFTFRVTSPEIGQWGPYDVYQMLIASFSNPAMSLLYIAAMVVLGLHLSHGISSLFQTLGINHGKYNPVLRALGPVLGTILALAYISIPAAVLLGILK